MLRTSPKLITCANNDRISIIDYSSTIQTISQPFKDFLCFVDFDLNQSYIQFTLLSSHINQILFIIQLPFNQFLYNQQSMIEKSMIN
jgi:hypothetical protein